MLRRYGGDVRENREISRVAECIHAPDPSVDACGERVGGEAALQVGRLIKMREDERR